MRSHHEPVLVWLIEDHEAYSRTIERTIKGLEGIDCARTFAWCEEALHALEEGAAPDVILLDVGLPGMNGLDGIRAIKSISPVTHVIMLTVSDDPQKIFEAICAGAAGYLLKEAPQENIGDFIREVMNGGAAMTPSIAQKVLEMFTRMAVPREDYKLTARERQILNLAVEGLIKKEIADRLGVSYHTVDAHLRNIYTKLQVHTRAGAVSKALKEHLF